MTIREHRANQLAVLTGVLVVALAALAALVQHVRTTAADAETLERGRVVYVTAGCARCHSIRGEGSTRAPLDGVGARLTAAQIEAWIVADAAVADALPRSVVARKTDYRALPDDDRAALVKWLAAHTSTGNDDAVE